jgi:hypothetical protein
MKGYRPSHFVQDADPDEIQQMQLMDPKRVRRIVVYAQRVRNGQPLFDEATDVPVRHFPNHRGTAHAG